MATHKKLSLKTCNKRNIPEFGDLIHSIRRVIRYGLSKRSSSESFSPIKLKPNLETTYNLIQDVLVREQPMAIPLWINNAVTKVIELGIRERACAFPGSAADLCHGHLLIPAEVKNTSFNQRMETAVGILFHAQECLEAKSYGLDPFKRNLFFDRQTEEVEILNPKKFKKVTSSLSIEPNDIREGFIAGGTIFFNKDQQGRFKFCSWDNWPLN